MTDNEIIEKIRTTLAEEFEVEIEKLQPEANLIEVLELDSLDFVDIVVLIEQNFGFTVSGNDFVAIKTFQDFYDFILTRIKDTEQ
mgnify:CR=1 FL=1